MAMSKKLIRLNESDLYRIVKESVNRVLNEMDDFVYDVNDYRDIGTTSGIRHFIEIQRLYNELGRLIKLGNDKPKWEFLQVCDWTKLFGRLSYEANRMKFETSSNTNKVNPEDMEYLNKFVKDVSRIPYPDLWVGSNSSFSEKADSVMHSLMIAHRLFGDFIEHFLDRHEGGEMKQQDIDADWKKFNKTRDEFDKRNRSNAESARRLRDLRNFAFSGNLKRGALKRYDIVSNPGDEDNQLYHDALIGV